MAKTLMNSRWCIVFESMYLCLVPEGPGRRKTEENKLFPNPFSSLRYFIIGDSFPICKNLV